MKKNATDIVGAAIKAVDGEIGKVSEFYFDDRNWAIRYLVIDTGNWLAERKVLLSPDVVLEPADSDDALPLNVTKNQVEHSPEVNTDKPVSRQQEIALQQHYTWDAYWGPGFAVPALSAPLYPPANTDNEEAHQQEGDPNLRSTKEIKGYSISATDNTIGDVDDFIVDDRTWRIHYLVIDTGKWLVGKKILLPVTLVKSIDWSGSSVKINASEEHLRTCPEYEDDMPVTKEVERQILNHYKASD